MTDLSTKKALVLDVNGLAIDLAVRMAEDFSEVFYFKDHMLSKEAKDKFIGQGMEGIERIFHFPEYIEKADLICFFDIGYGDWRDYIAKNEPGKRIWGPGLDGESIEHKRWKFRELTRKAGLPWQDTERITGITNLKEHINENPNRYIKVDELRSDVNSFLAKNVKSVQHILKKLDYSYGPFAEHQKFMSEEALDKKAIEIGADLIHGDHGFLSPMLAGIEYQKACYIGCWDGILEEQEPTIAFLEKILPECQYRGSISTEEKIIKDKSYIIDMTCRWASPVCICYPKGIKNFSEIIWKVAGGEEVEIENTSKYMGVLPLFSEDGGDNWTLLDFNHKYRDRIKLCKCAKVDGQFHAVFGSTIMYWLTSCRDSVDDVIEELEELAEKVDAYGIATDIAGGLHKIKSMCEELGWK